MNGCRPNVLAHRGFSAIAPENTMAAFRKAREAGADGIELDVHMTRDGEIVVIHDDKVDRTTSGSGLVADYTWADLRQLDAGSKFDPQFAGERIPALRQVCELMADWGAWLNIELKTNTVDYPGLEAAAIDTVKEYGIQEKVIFSSFNHYSLRRCIDLDPRVATALLYSEVVFEPWRYAELVGATGIHPYYRTLRDQIAIGTAEAGIAVRPWTVDGADEIERLAQLGVEAIITNRPDTAREVLGHV